MDKVGRTVAGFLMVLAVAVSLAACGSGQGVTVNLVEAQSGSSVQLQKDDTLVVELEAMPTTGFTWEVEGLDGAVVQQQGDPEFKGGEPGLVGASGKMIFTFKAVGKGQASLDMVYHQPWDTNTPPARTFYASVEVK